MTQANEALKHELALQRVATDLIRKGLFKSIGEAYKAVRMILLDAETITSPTKLSAVTRAINKVVDEAISEGWSEYTGELEKVAIYDAAFYAALIGDYADAKLKVPGKKSIADFINKALMSLNSGSSPKVGVWSEFVRNNVTGMAEQINNLVKAGYVNGATVGQMARTIKQFSDGLGRQQAEALARTGMQHYAQSARRAMVDDNLDIIEKEYPLVTFDNRTSQKCIGISAHYPDGWPVNQSPAGYPPYHYNCRTSLIYGISGLGDPRKSVKRPAVGSGANYPEDADKKPIYKGRSRNNGKFDVEQIPASTTFGGWLKGQDRAFIEDVLGKQKAQWFIEGKLSIERMSDAYGNPLTVDELIARYGL